ncbi:DUF3052 domain-containing protein [Streptomyces hydrogenans]|uniref:DUF3052 domain-containing protein n=1 Tax=Streptomyces hydrogenans TaxID=1873719 RepID=UPI00278C2CE1|nr:DUF3052 domain-containing protein [Streptomyces hydrogenans]
MTAEQTDPAVRLGLEPGQIVREVGHAEDVNQDLRAAIKSLTGQDLVDGDHDEAVDVVLLWHRDDDGDLADALTDAAGCLDDDGMVLLFTPEDGQDGYVEPADIEEATRTADLSSTRSTSVIPNWNNTKLRSPKTALRRH